MRCPSTWPRCARRPAPAWRIVGVFLGEQLVGGVALYETPIARGPRSSATARCCTTTASSWTCRRRSFTRIARRRCWRCWRRSSDTSPDMGYAHVLLHCDASVPDVRPFLAQGWQPSLSYTYVVPLADLADAMGARRPEPAAADQALREGGRHLPRRRRLRRPVPPAPADAPAQRRAAVPAGAGISALLRTECMRRGWRGSGMRSSRARSLRRS